MYLEQHSYNGKTWHIAGWPWLDVGGCTIAKQKSGQSLILRVVEGSWTGLTLLCPQKCLTNKISNVQWSCFYEKILLAPVFWSKTGKWGVKNCGAENGMRNSGAENESSFLPSLRTCCGGNRFCRDFCSEVFVCTILVILLHCFNFALQVSIIL